ncbi:dCTP deaminase [Stygiolobus rod-shaped virus]|uniref:Uncharacterized protein n=1 Tax=Stygiolobus rod-shaped virus TaxID=537009 RepID=B6EFB7_9VIRU|nr:dCTP deaminase [Stygiolobus rod-shaped virus]CAQ58452.1 hypothetical protein [Stygiolobus rod-shaped virus]
MVLSHQTIKKFVKQRKIIINPFFDDTVRENGIDLRLGNEILRFKQKLNIKSIDNLQNLYEKESGEHFVIYPNEHVLLTTLEYIKLPSDIMAFVNLRSTFARLGMMIPPTIVDAGFEGQLTIELINGPVPFLLDVGTRFLHLVFEKLDEPTQVPYQGKYQYQVGVTGVK